jgi:hypothetical protein
MADRCVCTNNVSTINVYTQREMKKKYSSRIIAQCYQLVVVVSMAIPIVDQREHRRYIILILV